MEDMTLNELKQIKLQDQIRDINLKYFAVKRKRRQTIGHILELLLLMLGITIASDFEFSFNRYFNIIFQLMGTEEDLAFSNTHFSPATFWYWGMAIGLVLLGLLIYRFVRKSRELTNLQLEVNKRKQEIKTLERYSY